MTHEHQYDQIQVHGLWPEIVMGWFCECLAWKERDGMREECAERRRRLLNAP